LTYRRIARWTLEGGPEWGDHLADYEWLTSQSGKNAPPSHRIGRAGTLLEQLLQNLCHSLRAQVVFDIKGHYTLDPLWSGFQSKLKSNKAFKSAVQNCVDQISSIQWYRNAAGAHHNEWASNISSDEAKEFVDAVIALRQMTYCDSCGKFIKKPSDLEGLWACPKRCVEYDEKKMGG
jgi:hypothetical protein